MVFIVLLMRTENALAYLHASCGQSDKCCYATVTEIADVLSIEYLFVIGSQSMYIACTPLA